MAIKQVLTIYSQKTGLDIAAETRENEAKTQHEGIVQFRFFHLQLPTDGKPESSIAEIMTVEQLTLQRELCRAELSSDSISGLVDEVVTAPNGILRTLSFLWGHLLEGVFYLSSKTK